MIIDAKRIKQDLLFMKTASCTCLTKTPDAEYHSSSCRYRQLSDAFEYIEYLETKIHYLTKCYEGDKPR